MKIESGGRGSGKTAKMIDWLHKHEDAILYTHSEQEAERLRERYDHDGTMGLAARIVTPKVRAKPSFYYPMVAIDNVDLVLRQLFGDVRIVTVTEDD